MQFQQQDDYNRFAAAAAAPVTYPPNIYYEQQQAMMPPHDALLYDLNDAYAQPLPPSDQMIIPSTTSNNAMIVNAGVSATATTTPTTTANNSSRKRPKRKQVKNACVNCQKACKKCDDGRPCQRCIKLGLTATCTNSPRKERKKGVKRGPYKKRQQQQQQQQQRTHAASAKKMTEQATWDKATSGNLPAMPFNTPADNVVYPQRIITPPLTQQESPLDDSPLSADAAYGYVAAATTVVDCDGSCSSSSPISPEFPVNAWDDPLFGLMPTDLAEPIMVQDLASVPSAMPQPQYAPFDDAAVAHDMMIKPQQQYYYPVAQETMCTSCIPQQQQQQQFNMPYNHGNHHHMYHQQQYMHQQQHQNGYWQTFLTNA